jgi:3-oxoadipate enol-lactonase
MSATETAGGSIAWHETGNGLGPPIILLHSLGTDRSMWGQQVTALAGSHRVILIDIRGHGRSESPPGPYGLDDLANDVVAVADDIGIDRFDFCGISISGQIGLWLGINRPERLRTLTVANTAAKIGTREGWEDRIAAVRDGGMASIREPVVARWFAEDFPERYPDVYQRVGAVFAATSPIGYVGCCAALAEADLSGVVATITTPTLVIGGELDVSTPPANVESLHRAIPESDLVMIPGAGHLSNMDRPDQFNAALLGHLQKSS